MLCPNIAYRCVGINPVNIRPAIISAAVSCPGAATLGKLSCVTGVNRSFNIREYEPISPNIKPMLGISGVSNLLASIAALYAN